MDLLKQFLSKLNENELKIAVVGDSILDEYYQVEANRISPEFPIPVMRSDEMRFSYAYPGGAANVVLQLRNWNVEPYLVSVIDRESRAIFDGFGIDTSCCKCWNDPIIPRKKRFYKGEFPLCRWDIEKPNMGLEDYSLYSTQLDLLDKVNSLKPDVVILSDYGKGTFKNVSGEISINGNKSKEMWIWHVDYIPNQEEGKKPWITIVDPKNDNLFEWAGCTVFKPNVHEAELLTGESDHFEQVRKIKNILNCESVVVTHGGEKIIGKDNEEWVFYGGYKKEARYPIGAGDCFIAALAMAYPFFSPEEAARIAYEIGAFYVNTKDRYVSPEDILGNRSKIMSPEQLAKEVVEHSEDKFALANGCFDIIHSGHLELLKFGKSKADKLIVALNDDKSVERLKGSNRPVKPLEQRMKVLEGMEVVDYITWFSEDTPLNIIKRIKPYCIIKGKGYDKKDVVGADVVSEVHIAPTIEELSSSKFIDKLY